MRSLFAKPVPDFNLVKDKLPPVFFNRLTTYRLKQVEREKRKGISITSNSSCESLRNTL